MTHHYAGFDEFWPDYVREHQHPMNRAMHLLGTGVAATLVATALVKRKPLLLLAAPIAGYGTAFLGHILFEKNLPTSLEHPVYSLLANFVMIGKMLRGRMSDEAARHRPAARPPVGTEPVGSEPPVGTKPAVPPCPVTAAAAPCPAETASPAGPGAAPAVPAPVEPATVH